MGGVRHLSWGGFVVHAVRLMVKMWRSGQQRDKMLQLQSKPDCARKRSDMQNIARQYVKTDLMNMLNVFSDVRVKMEQGLLDEKNALEVILGYHAWVQGVGLTADDTEKKAKWNGLLTGACEVAWEQQAKFCNVAGPADIWTKSTMLRVNAFYACRAGAIGSECDCLISSEEWARNIVSLSEGGEYPRRCYCGICSARRKNKYGMVIELRLVANDGTKWSYMARTDATYEGRFMDMEHAFKKRMIRHQELFASIPATENAGDGFRLKQVVPGHFGLVPLDYSNDWYGQRIGLSKLPFVSSQVFYDLCHGGVCSICSKYCSAGWRWCPICKRWCGRVCEPENVGVEMSRIIAGPPIWVISRTELCSTYQRWINVGV